ncbi:MAG: DUF3810 domain-containing protein [Saprospiraceae bacterium]|nr:DUF3810 domain-containing protein [Saprospiraceae bacterium]
MKHFLWPSALFLALIARAVFQVNPELTESIYTRGLFAGIRWLLDHTLGWLPFPSVYLLFGLMLWVLGRFIVSLITMPGRDALLRLGFFTLNTIAGIGTLFLVLWGFNYCRLPVEKQLGLEVKNPSATALRTEFERQTAVVLKTRTKLQYDTATAIPTLRIPLSMESDIRGMVEKKYKELGLPAAGRPRGREPFWNGFLIRFGAAGIYNPFTGEGNIDRGLYFLTKPYNLAHELGHAYGWGDEGTCTFLAYLALSASEEPLYRYSAELGYWRELASAYRRAEPEQYKVLFEQLPTGFVTDLVKIREAVDRYPEFFEAFRRKTYDNYLKSQGIREGMANYGKVVPLVMAWRSLKFKD